MNQTRTLFSSPNPDQSPTTQYVASIRSSMIAIYSRFLSSKIKDIYTMMSIELVVHLSCPSSSSLAPHAKTTSNFWAR